MKALDDVKAQSLQDIQKDFTEEDLSQNDSIEEADVTIKVLIVDAMAVLQCMKKKNTIQTLSDLKDAFNEHIQNMVSGYDKVQVVFDRYMDQSLKNNTRQKKAATSVEYEIHLDMKLTMPIKDLLSASSTKKKLTFMLGEGLLKYFSSDSSILLFYDTFIKGHGFEQENTHEEADTVIPHQVLTSVANGTMQEIPVWSSDIDVLLLLLDLVSCSHIASPIHLKLIMGKGTKKREIDVIERVQAIGCQKRQGLLGFHYFFGADWGGKFVGITKNYAMPT